MNIGVTAVFKGSAFNGSLPQVAVFMARALQSCGHKVEYLVQNDSDLWFTDCSGVKNMETVKVDDKVEKYDLIIEVCWYLAVDIRKQKSLKTVMFYHDPPVFDDMENSIYNTEAKSRFFTNLDALWTWAHFKPSDVNYLELLSKLPVYTCPYIWEPVFLGDAVTKFDTDSKPGVLICENNRTNSSSCIVPMAILSEIRNKDANINFTITNSAHLLLQPYFYKNIAVNINLGKDFGRNFVERVPIVDEKFLTKKYCVLSHQRWLPLKYVLLDALWLGFPIIHNCKLLSSMKGGENYYEYNAVGQALQKWESVLNMDWSARANDLQEIRDGLMKRWGPDAFKQAVPGLLDALTK